MSSECAHSRHVTVDFQGPTTTQPHCLLSFTLALSRPKSGPQGDGNHLGGLTQARGDHQGGAWAWICPLHRPCQPDICRGRVAYYLPRQPFEQTMNTILGT